MNPGGPPRNPDGSPMYPGLPQLRGPMTPAFQQAFDNLCQVAGWDPNFVNANAGNFGDDYRPVMDTQDLGTPGTHGSNIDPNADFPINTDEYELSDMEPTGSPPEQAPQAHAKGKGKGKGKKATEETLHPIGRKLYSPEETVTLSRCWVDISEDPIFANNQKVNKFWSRIADRYNSLKLAWGKERSADQLRKHWDRVKADISKFAAVYHNTERMWGSGQSLEDLRDKAMKTYSNNGINPEFKYYDVYLLVKDLPKFQAGYEPSGPKRTKVNASGSYSSSGGGDAFDLNSPYGGECWHKSANRKSPNWPKSGQEEGEGKGDRAFNRSAAGRRPKHPGVGQCIFAEDVVRHRVQIL